MVPPVTAIAQGVSEDSVQRLVSRNMTYYCCLLRLMHMSYIMYKTYTMIDTTSILGKGERLGQLSRTNDGIQHAPPSAAATTTAV